MVFVKLIDTLKRYEIIHWKPLAWNAVQYWLIAVKAFEIARYILWVVAFFGYITDK